MSRQVTVKMATDEDGPRIGDLLLLCGFNQPGWDIDWTDIGPWWIAAEIDGVVEAAVQVCPAKPIARAEMLVINPDLPQLVRARIVIALMTQIRGYVKQCGITGFAGMITDDMHSWLNVAERRGYVSVAEGHAMIKRV